MSGSIFQSCLLLHFMFAILRVCNATLIPNDYLSAALNQSKDLESSNSANNPDSLLSAEISEAETKQQNSGNMKRRDVSRDFLPGILRTFQEHACDGEELHLRCPPNTVISISLVQYAIAPLTSLPSPSGQTGRGGKASDQKGSQEIVAESASHQQQQQQKQSDLCQMRRHVRAKINSHQSSDEPASASSSSSSGVFASSSPPYVYPVDNQHPARHFAPVSAPFPPQDKHPVRSSSSDSKPSVIENNNRGHENMSSSNNNISAQDSCNARIETLRYSLLRKVESTCREKNSCRIMTSPESLSAIDPCPGISKLTEVAFKCKPNVFSNKVACDGSVLRLKCRQSNEGIAILSAFYGSTGQHVAECPPKSDVTSDRKEDPTSQQIPSDERDKDSKQANKMANSLPICQSSFATERLMTRCVGKGSCNVTVDSSTFGTVSSCRSGSELHAKATYACVSRQVLKGLFAPHSEPDANRADSKGSDESVMQSLGDKSDPKGGTDVSQDLIGFVDAPRYVPDQDMDEKRPEEHDVEDDSGNRPSGNPFTQIRRLFRKEERSKSPAKTSSLDQIKSMIHQNSDQEKDTHQKWISDGIRFWFSISRGFSERRPEVVWYTFTFLSIVILMGLILVSLLMFKKSYAQSSLLNQEKRQQPVPVPDVDGDFGGKTSTTGNKSPPPAPFDASDEALAALEAEGLVRSPTLFDYRHEDKYGFLPTHVPGQTVLNSIPDHHDVDPDGDDGHHHSMLEKSSFEITSIQLPHLHDYHQQGDDCQMMQQRLVPVSAACVSQVAGGVHQDHNNHLSQYQTIVRLNHVHPILRSSQPHLHQHHHLTMDQEDGNNLTRIRCSHHAQTVPETQLSLISSGMTATGPSSRLFHTLGGRNSSSTPSNRVSTIDRNSLFRDNEKQGSIFVNESTPPRAISIADENHYY